MKEERISEMNDGPQAVDARVEKILKPKRALPPLSPEKAVEIARSTPPWKEPKADDYLPAMLIYASKGIPLGDAAVLLNKFGCRVPVADLIAAYSRKFLGPR